jgi:glycosyl hydrolase family 39 (putative alpha-L-iduronidase)
VVSSSLFWCLAVMLGSIWHESFSLKEGAKVTRLQLIAIYAAWAGCMSLGTRSSHSGMEVPMGNLRAMSTETLSAQFSSQFIGMHTLSPVRHWPTVAFGSMRPAGVTWGALEPAREHYDWHSLDSWVAQAQSHAVRLDYVFLNTPRWASTRPDEPCIGGRFGCAAPPNMNDWEQFVKALVSRYKGRISSYEMWNEPNASGFWSGSPQDMVELAAHAYPIIRSIDPAAIITTPAASSTGWPLSHDAWLDQYLSAGGGKYADVVAWHGYSGRNDRPALPVEDLTRQIQALRTVLERHHMNEVPIWDTEGGWGKDAQLPAEDEQASFLVKWYLIQFTNGIARAYWYQWDNPAWGTLWREQTGLTPAGGALIQVVSWLDGATSSTPCKPVRASAMWTCDIQKGGVLYRAAWSTSGRTTFANNDRVASFTEVGGVKQISDGRPVIVGSRPILFQIKGSDN